MMLMKYFILFFIYSFIGWCIEVIDTLIEKKQLVNRGFLIGPYCPIHGVGAMLSIFLFRDIADNQFTVFILGMILCSILEYLTSYIMEKAFHARWWDYSNDAYNLNGRIKLLNSLFFGMAIFIVVCIVNPFLEVLIFSINDTLIKVMFSIAFIIMLIDFIISFKIINSIKNMSRTKKDNTYEISMFVRRKLKNSNILLKRLIKAFPNIVKNKIIFKK